MEDMYLLARKTVLEKINIDDEMFSFYVASLYCLLCKFSDYKDIVVDSFLNTDFYFEKGSIIDILKRHSLSPENIDEIEEEQEEFENYAVSNLGHEFYYDVESGVCHVFHNPYIVASINNFSIERLLNSFCHEMAHIIKGRINGFEILSNDKDSYEFYYRSGFSYDYYFMEDNELYHYNSFGIFDEIINVFQTTETLSYLSSLKDFVSDSDILDFISKLDLESLKRDYGYEEVLNVLRSLWENERFKKFAENDVICGEYTLKDDFDAVFSDEKFDLLGSYLNELYDLLFDDDNYERINFILEDCSKMIKAYNNKYKEYVKSK